ncbi:hypothetical protein FRC08_015740 [Ceratobasidium sp. 394]|nr:hypothetical protein FRC08_015740 [Ceratobasidium sp. 394]
MNLRNRTMTLALVDLVSPRHSEAEAQALRVQNINPNLDAHKTRLPSNINVSFSSNFSFITYSNGSTPTPRVRRSTTVATRVSSSASSSTSAFIVLPDVRRETARLALRLGRVELSSASSSISSSSGWPAMESLLMLGEAGTRIVAMGGNTSVSGRTGIG